jgi:hypothetical protein
MDPGTAGGTSGATAPSAAELLHARRLARASGRGDAGARDAPPASARKSGAGAAGGGGAPSDVLVASEADGGVRGETWLDKALRMFLGVRQLRALPPAGGGAGGGGGAPGPARARLAAARDGALLGVHVYAIDGLPPAHAGLMRPWVRAHIVDLAAARYVALAAPRLPPGGAPVALVPAGAPPPPPPPRAPGAPPPRVDYDAPAPATVAAQTRAALNRTLKKDAAALYAAGLAPRRAPLGATPTGGCGAARAEAILWHAPLVFGAELAELAQCATAAVFFEVIEPAAAAPGASWGGAASVWWGSERVVGRAKRAPEASAASVSEVARGNELLTLGSTRVSEVATGN